MMHGKNTQLFGTDTICASTKKTGYTKLESVPYYTCTNSHLLHNHLSLSLSLSLSLIKYKDEL